MSLRWFHAFFILLCLLLCAVVAAWAWGMNASAQKTPWALLASLLGAALMVPYLFWYARKARLPQ